MAETNRLNMSPLGAALDDVRSVAMEVENVHSYSLRPLTPTVVVLSDDEVDGSPSHDDDVLSLDTGAVDVTPVPSHPDPRMLERDAAHRATIHAAVASRSPDTQLDPSRRVNAGAGARERPPAAAATPTRRTRTGAGAAPPSRRRTRVVEVDCEDDETFAPEAESGGMAEDEDAAGDEDYVEPAPVAAGGAAAAAGAPAVNLNRSLPIKHGKAHGNFKKAKKRSEAHTETRQMYVNKYNRLGVRFRGGVMKELSALCVEDIRNTEPAERKMEVLECLEKYVHYSSLIQQAVISGENELAKMEALELAIVLHRVDNPVRFNGI